MARRHPKTEPSVQMVKSKCQRIEKHFSHTRAEKIGVGPEIGNEEGEREKGEGIIEVKEGRERTVLA